MKKEVRAFVFISPVDFCEVQIIDRNNSEVMYKEYRCPNCEVAQRLSYDDEEFEYSKIILAGGPENYSKNIEEKIKAYYPDVYIKVVK